MFNLSTFTNLPELISNLEQKFPVIFGYYRIIVLDKFQLPSVLYHAFSAQESRYIAEDVMDSSKIENCQTAQNSANTIRYSGYKFMDDKDSGRVYFIPDSFAK